MKRWRPFGHAALLASLRTSLATSLAISLALVAGACRPKHGGGERTTTSGDSGTETSASSKTASVVGPYECTALIADKEFTIESCSIRSTQKLSLAGPQLHLSGEVVARDHGLAFEGQLQLGTENHPVSCDFYRQGAGSFAAVIPVAGSRLAKITMVPRGGASEIPSPGPSSP